MNDPLFPLQGKTIAPMFGREALFQDVWFALEKSPPDNISIVGPLSIGKSVLLNALAVRARQDDSPFALVVHWHLGHVCPTTDEEFIGGLCEALSEAISSNKDVDGSYVGYLAKKSYTHLKEITTFLDGEKKRILMIWDGFDKPLRQENLSLRLWDQMREIFTKGHAIVTATRKPLDELIRNEDAMVSPFWNILNPMTVGPLDDTDREAFYQHANLKMSTGARTEVANWTAGHPPLFISVVNHLVEQNLMGEIDDKATKSSAETVAKEIKGKLKILWDDCIASAKDGYLALVDKGEVPEQEIGYEGANCLLDRGFAIRHRTKLKPSCHMLREHIQSTAPDAGSLNRLFGTWGSYQSEISHVLELRLEQIPRVDSDLYRWVSRAIRDIPENPGDCLMNLTEIEAKAIDLVMDHELGRDRLVPDALVEYWKDANHHQDKVVSQLAGQKGRGEPLTVPKNDRALQCGLLQLLTGSKERLERKTKSVSKDTYAIVNALHGLRNRKDHPDEQPVSVDVAVSTMMMCLALLDCLARELG